jgi:hypothetical protein
MKKLKTGRKPKPEGKSVSHFVSAGFTGEEWPKVLAFVKKSGKTKSTIVRNAFGLGEAEK